VRSSISDILSILRLRFLLLSALAVLVNYQISSDMICNCGLSFMSRSPVPLVTIRHFKDAPSTSRLYFRRLPVRSTLRALLREGGTEDGTDVLSMPYTVEREDVELIEHHSVRNFEIGAKLLVGLRNIDINSAFGQKREGLKRRRADVNL
jgi:hypothetical protein